MDWIINMINAAVLAGTPLLLGTMGEILTEKSGNLNLGVEGMMFMGGIAGLAASFYYEAAVTASGGVISGFMSAVYAVIGAFLCGAFGALIYSFLTVTLRANQNVTGLTLAIFGTGFANFFGEHLALKAGGYAAVSSITKATFTNPAIPTLANIPYIGRLLFGYNFVVYLGVAIALVLFWFFNHTRTGLNLRAVGESPATADAAGLNVARYKYLATCIGGGICGLGGMYVTMVTCSGVWVHNSVNGQGWIAVALVIFAAWSPARGILGALLFGGLSILRLYLPLGIPMQIYDMLPFVATVIVLIMTSIRQIRENSQPRSCGVNYFREER